MNPATFHMPNVASNFEMTYKHLTFILVFIPIGLFSQQFEKVDTYVKYLQVDKTLSLDKLTEKLTNPFPVEIDKVRAIYYWIADNIKYDYVSYKNRIQISSQPEIVYLNRIAVCAGYSNLFAYMLDLVGIENNVISGYTRKELDTTFRKETNHAWNSIKLNNKWYLFDVTWARDTLNNTVHDFYFKTDPEIFILNHYPTDYKWALLDTKYSPNDYMRFPVYTNLFYDLKFTDTISKEGFFNAKNDTVRIKIKPSFDCLILTQLYDTRSVEWINTQRGDVIRGDDFFKMYIPRKGKFILKVGALLQDDNSFRIYDEIIFYTVENK